MAGHGGARKGAGRKRNSENTFTKRISKYCEDFISTVLNDDIAYQQLLKEDRANQLRIHKQKIKEEDYLYLIKNNGIYKIGYSSNWNKRFTNYKTHLGKVDLIYLTKQKDCFEIESFLHEKFKDNNVKGEWFNLNNDDILYIISYCSNLIN